MTVLYTVIALITFIIIILILGKIDFNEKPKKYILQIVSGIYNMFLGYIDTYVINHHTTLLYHLTLLHLFF